MAQGLGIKGGRIPAGLRASNGRAHSGLQLCAASSVLMLCCCDRRHRPRRAALSTDGKSLEPGAGGQSTPRAGAHKRLQLLADLARCVACRRLDEFPAIGDPAQVLDRLFHGIVIIGDGPTAISGVGGLPRFLE